MKILLIEDDLDLGNGVRIALSDQGFDVIWVRRKEDALHQLEVGVPELKKLWASRPDVPARCVVSANACWYFKSISEEAEQASLAVLARHTVASALDEVKKADTSGCDPLPELIAQYKKAQ